MANTSGSCWCTKKYFPKEVFELVPEDSVNKHCICKNCLEQYEEMRAK